MERNEFRGIRRKKTVERDWSYLLMSSKDYGEWGCNDEEKRKKKSKKAKRKGGEIIGDEFFESMEEWF